MTNPRIAAHLAILGGATFRDNREAIALAQMLAAAGPSTWEGDGYRATVRADGEVSVTYADGYEARGEVADVATRLADVTARGRDISGRLMALEMKRLGVI